MKLPYLLAASLVLFTACKSADEGGKNVTLSDNKMSFTVDLPAATVAVQSTKTNKTADLANKSVGLYLAVGSPLSNSGNIYHNIEGRIASDYAVTPVSSMFYPSVLDNVDLYYYLPYGSTIGANPNAISCSVSAVQTTTTMKGEDVLFGKTTTTTVPSSTSTAVDLKLQHALSLVKYKIVVPAKFMDKDVSSVEQTRLINTALSGTMNLGSQSVAPASTPNYGDIEPVFVGSTPDATAGGATYEYTALVIPQTVKSGTRLVRFEVKLGDSSVELFTHTLNADFIFKSGHSHELTFLLADYGKLELTSATITSDWIPSVILGNMGEKGVENTFTIQMVNQSQDYTQLVKKVKLLINNVEYTYDVTGFSGNMYNGSVSFKTPDINSKNPDTYPYLVQKATLIGSTDNVLLSKYYSAEVSAGGNVLLPWYEYTTTGGNVGFTISGWAGTTGSVDNVVAVSNTFTFMYCDNNATVATACDKVTIVKLTIGGTVVSLPAVTMTTGQFAARTNAAVALPAGTASSLKYPYTITNIELLNGTTPIYSVSANMSITLDGLVAVTINK